MIDYLLHRIFRFQKEVESLIVGVLEQRMKCSFLYDRKLRV